jgi:hypothetical protein
MDMTIFKTKRVNDRQQRQQRQQQNNDDDEMVEMIIISQLNFVMCCVEYLSSLCPNYLVLYSNNVFFLIFIRVYNGDNHNF